MKSCGLFARGGDLSELMGSLYSAILRPTISGDEVYVAAVPLRAPKRPAQLLMSSAYSLDLWDLHHFFVIIKPHLHSQALVFDFQPKEPENIYSALAVVSGRSLPGIVLKRKLTMLPRNKCWFVGSCEEDAVDKTSKFNDSWGTDLIVGSHDCRDYTNGLVEHLTGEKQVLARLRRSTSGRT